MAFLKRFNLLSYFFLFGLILFGLPCKANTITPSATSSPPPLECRNAEAPQCNGTCPGYSPYCRPNIDNTACYCAPACGGTAACSSNACPDPGDTCQLIDGNCQCTSPSGKSQVDILTE